MIVTNHITYLATILGASPEYVTSSIAFIDALSLASLVPYITGQTRVPVSDWLRWKLSGTRRSDGASALAAQCRSDAHAAADAHR